MWTVEEGIDVLKESGAKITAQRIAILEQLMGRTDHPSADTLYRELLEKYPTMSVATLYSTVQRLSEAGLLKILSIDGKRVYFDPVTVSHGHFMCRKCGRLIDVPLSREIFHLTADASAIAHIERTEVFMYGVCRDCFDD